MYLEAERQISIECMGACDYTLRWTAAACIALSRRAISVSGAHENTLGCK